MPQNPPKIFLAHANEDKEKVRELYGRLVEAGYKPWFDEEDLLPGQNWRDEIPKALKKSDMFIACLSSTSISKRGYIQKEFRMAMEMMAELPQGTIYFIPLKFDDCQIPELRQSEYGLNLRDLQWLDYGKPNGFEKLMKSIEHRFGSQGTRPQNTATSQAKSQPSIVQDHQGSGDNIAGNKTVNNYYSPPPTPTANDGNTEALQLWTQKLTMYRKEEAIASDPEKKFQLKVLIQECQDKIKELGG